MSEKEYRLWKSCNELGRNRSVLMAMLLDTLNLNGFQKEIIEKICKVVNDPSSDAYVRFSELFKWYETEGVKLGAKNPFADYLASSFQVTAIQIEIIDLLQKRLGVEFLILLLLIDDVNYASLDLEIDKLKLTFGEIQERYFNMIAGKIAIENIPGYLLNTFEIEQDQLEDAILEWSESSLDGLDEEFNNFEYYDYEYVDDTDYEQLARDQEYYERLTLKTYDELTREPDKKNR